MLRRLVETALAIGGRPAACGSACSVTPGAWTSQATSLTGAARARGNSGPTWTSLRRCGRHIPDLTPEEVFKLAIHDVSRSFIASMNKEGYVQPSLDELTRMRIHGVDASYVQGLRKAGYNNLSIGELVKTRIHGATPEFACRGSGRPASASSASRPRKDAHSWRHAGNGPRVARAGYKDLRVDDVVKLKIHGATPEYIRQIRGVGYKDLALSDLVRMRIHGVSVEYVKESATRIPGRAGRGAGADEDHGVTPQFIKEVSAAGYKKCPSRTSWTSASTAGAGSRSAPNLGFAPNKNASA